MAVPEESRWGISHRRHLCWAWVLALAGFILGGCRETAPDPGATEESVRIAFVVYDAGETLALLPVVDRLEEENPRVGIRWVPLTPWAADLLADNDQVFHPLPDGIEEMPHIKGREGESDLGYWKGILAQDSLALVVSGMVSKAQGELGLFLRESGVPTRGMYDGFPPPTEASIGFQTASSFDEVWVSTQRVRDGFQALGIDARVGGQPTLEAWRRTAEEVDPSGVRDRLGAGPSTRILTWAGQYGPGYRDVLDSFLTVMSGILDRDSSLLLVLSNHPRTDGSVERAALEVAGFRLGDMAPGPLGGAGSDTRAVDRAVMMPDGLNTMELATVSEVVLTWASTVGTQAAFLGKQVVYFSPPEGFDSYLVDRGVAFQADPGTLPTLLAGALVDPRPPDLVRQMLVEAGFVVNADGVVARLILDGIGR